MYADHRRTKSASNCQMIITDWPRLRIHTPAVSLPFALQRTFLLGASLQSASHSNVDGYKNCIPDLVLAVGGCMLTTLRVESYCDNTINSPKLKKKRPRTDLGPGQQLNYPQLARYPCTWYSPTPWRTVEVKCVSILVSVDYDSL